MKKVIGVVCAMLMASVVLTGCYSKCCDQPVPAQKCYKGENM